MTRYIAVRIMLVMMLALLVAAIAASTVGFNNPLYEP